MKSPDYLKVESQFLSGGGEMGELMRQKDWSKTSLGPVECWPQSLKTIINVCLNSKFPIMILWGEDLINIYNDSLKPILGEDKHPFALGAPAHEIWTEIWDIVEPMLLGVYEEGKSTWSEHRLLLLHRNGYKEECYFTFSFSPIHDELGVVRGVFTAVTETTREVISARYLGTMRDLSTILTLKTNELDIYKRSLRVMMKNTKDFPFAVLYRIEDDGNRAIRVASTDSEPACPREISLGSGDPDPWKIHDVVESNKEIILNDLTVFGQLPKGAWEESAKKVLLLPIVQRGKSFPFAVLIIGLNPFRKPDHEALGFYRLLADQIAGEIVGLRNYEHERRRAEVLAETNKSKTIFFTNISHEFRTPLTLILAPLETLLVQNNTPPDIKYELNNVHRNAKRLYRLVNTLLDFSSIESGRMKARYCRTSLDTFTRYLASGFQSTLENAGLIYRVQCAPVENAYVDASMWEKIVINLISNAYKYTPSGSVDVKLFAEDQQAVLEVADTGIGIPNNEIDKIFDRFYRSVQTRSRTMDGTGIGLALAMELVNLHHGRITVESREGEGSIFRVYIPLGKEHLPPDQIFQGEPLPEGELPPFYLDEIRSPKEMTERIPAQSPEGLYPVRPPRILVADDNPDILAYIEKILKATYQVETASNGKVALSKIFESPPDLVITDIVMPSLTGMDLLHALKSNLRTSGIPVILLSARSAEEAKIEGYKTGADDYLVKPFSAKELIARVNSQVKLRHERKHAEAFLREVFEQAPVPICFLKGPEFRIEQANSFMLDLWGKTADEVLFKPMATVFPEMVDQGFLALLNDVYRKGERFQAEETPLSIMRNGKLDHKYVSFVYEPFKDPAGNVTAIVSVGYDVTGLVLGKKSAQQHAHEFELQVSSRTAELRSKNEELLLKASELEQFTFLASHDLQEPLRKILTFSGLMMHNIQDHKVVEKYVNKIVSSVSRMSGLIQSLLDYTRLSQSNGLFVTIDLNTILKSVLEDLDLLISEKNCTVHATNLPVVIGDPRQLGQLFLNLIHNAIKFCKATPALNISWQVVGEPEKNKMGLSPSSDFIRLDFADNGIGFESHFTAKVFEMFQRLHSTADYPGMGIGLSLCKKIAENHHGAISAESTLGTGSCFHVYLPAGQPA